MTATQTPPPRTLTTSDAATRVTLTTVGVALALATFATGLDAGFFFAYWVSVVRGLALVDDVTYVTAFQAINETIQSVPFFSVFFGASATTVAAAVIGWRAGRGIRALLALAVLMSLATVAITAAGNVPLNEQLAGVTAVGPGTAASARAAFEDPWNRLNAIRTVTAALAFASMAGAAVTVRNQRRPR